MAMLCFVFLSAVTVAKGVIVFIMRCPRRCHSDKGDWLVINIENYLKHIGRKYEKSQTIYFSPGSLIKLVLLVKDLNSAALSAKAVKSSQHCGQTSLLSSSLGSFLITKGTRMSQV